MRKFIRPVFCIIRPPDFKENVLFKWKFVYIVQNQMTCCLFGYYLKKVCRIKYKTDMTHFFYHYI